MVTINFYYIWQAILTCLPQIWIWMKKKVMQLPQNPNHEGSTSRYFVIAAFSSTARHGVSDHHCNSLSVLNLCSLVGCHCVCLFTLSTQQSGAYEGGAHRDFPPPLMPFFFLVAIGPLFFGCLRCPALASIISFLRCICWSQLCSVNFPKACEVTPC